MGVPGPVVGHLDANGVEVFASVSSRGSQSDSLPDLMLVEHCFRSSFVSGALIPLGQCTLASGSSRDFQHPATGELTHRRSPDHFLQNLLLLSTAGTQLTLLLTTDDTSRF